MEKEAYATSEEEAEKDATACEVNAQHAQQHNSTVRRLARPSIRHDHRSVLPHALDMPPLRRPLLYRVELSVLSVSVWWSVWCCHCGVVR